MGRIAIFRVARKKLDARKQNGLLPAKQATRYHGNIEKSTVIYYRVFDADRVDSKQEVHSNALLKGRHSNGGVVRTGATPLSNEEREPAESAGGGWAAKSGACDLGLLDRNTTPTEQGARRNRHSYNH